MRKYLWVLLLGLIGCAIIPAHISGQSASFGGDNILRNDLIAKLRQYERLFHQCHRIDAIHAQIIQTRKVNGLLVVDERWDIKACGQNRHYPIQLREDQKGETDFTITVNAK